MNNEEKILEMLVKHSAILEKLTDKVDGLRSKVDELDGKVAELDDRSLRSAVLLETEVARDIRLVYEGQALLKEKMDGLATARRVASVEDDVAMLKDVVKLMRLEINERKQAQ
ncbi:MAG: hypothetical protein K2P20_03510 [Oscillospiraceae bacterium]|nr:hypothetical protein [Oscillospiraceae bacterium]